MSGELVVGVSGSPSDPSRTSTLVAATVARLGEEIADARTETVEIGPLLARHGTAHWVDALDRAGVPGGPVLTYPEALAQAQVAAREMVVEVEHPVIGPMRVLGTPAKMSATPPTIRRPAPLLGQHSREVLREAGHAEHEIDSLVARGIVDEPSGSP